MLEIDLLEQVHRQFWVFGSFPKVYSMSDLTSKGVKLSRNFTHRKSGR